MQKKRLPQPAEHDMSTAYNNTENSLNSLGMGYPSRRSAINSNPLRGECSHADVRAMGLYTGLADGALARRRRTGRSSKAIPYRSGIAKPRVLSENYYGSMVKTLLDGKYSAR